MGANFGQTLFTVLYIVMFPHCTIMLLSCTLYNTTDLGVVTTRWGGLHFIVGLKDPMRPWLSVCLGCCMAVWCVCVCHTCMYHLTLVRTMPSHVCIMAVTYYARTLSATIPPHNAACFTWNEDDAVSKSPKDGAHSTKGNNIVQTNTIYMPSNVQA